MEQTDIMNRIDDFRRERKKMKLEELLGEELYKQVQEKLDAVNANEPDKFKHIRYADLSEGEYISRMKHTPEVDKLNSLLSEKDVELKKATKGNEEIQGKVAELQTQLQETKIKSAIKVALLSEKAVDVDYLIFKLNEKLKEKGEALELDGNDNIKGWEDMMCHSHKSLDYWLMNFATDPFCRFSRFADRDSVRNNIFAQTKTLKGEPSVSLFV